MRKKTIAILFGTGFGLVLIGTIVMFVGGAAIGAAAASCDSATTYCDPSAGMEGGLSALLILGILVITAGSILTMISWIATLVKQAQRQQWAWFICTLLFSGICTLLWLIIEPDVPAVPQYVPVYQPLQAGYPPAYPADGPYPPTSYPPAGQPPYYQDPYRPQ